MTTQRQQRKRPRKISGWAMPASPLKSSGIINRMKAPFPVVDKVMESLIIKGQPILSDGTAADPDKFGVVFIDARR